MYFKNVVMLLADRQQMPNTKALHSVKSDFHFYIPHSPNEIESWDALIFTTSNVTYYTSRNTAGSLKSC